MHDKQVALPAKAKHSDKQASGTHGSTTSVHVVSKAGKTSYSGSAQNQTAATSAGGSKHQEKLASAPAAVKGTVKAQKRVKEEGEVSEDSDADKSQTQKSAKGASGFRIGLTRRTSRAVALSFTTFHKRQRKRTAKGMGASPEAGAEAGAQSGEEAAMPLECKASESSEKRVHKRHHRKSLFGYKRKPSTGVPGIKYPKLGRVRTRRVFYTYEPEPLPPTAVQDGNEPQIQGQNPAPSEEEPSSISEQEHQSSNNNSSTTVTSGRSSRVIKTPKRFLDEEMIPFPKGSLSTWLKTKQRDDGKSGASLNESGYSGNSQPLDIDSMSEFYSPSGVPKISSGQSPGASHVEIYKNLKKLTLKLAAKKKGQSNFQEDTHHGDSLTSHIRKRRRPKLMMEELDTPGVIRKLAVVVNADVESSSRIKSEDSGNNRKSYFVFLFV